MFAGDTVLVEGVSGHVEIRRCDRRGCQRAAADDSEKCAKHAEDQRRYQREYMARQRETWEKKRRCTRCGGKRAPKSKWCGGCLVKNERVHHSAVKSHVENRRDRIRARLIPWENSPQNAGRVRLRGGKRGAPSVEQLDGVDLRYARRDFDHGVEGLAYFRTPEVQSMGGMQRDDVKREALAKLAEARGWINDILRRHKHEEIEVGDEKEDEPMPPAAAMRGKMGGR